MIYEVDGEGVDEGVSRGVWWDPGGVNDKGGDEVVGISVDGEGEDGVNKDDDEGVDKSFIKDDYEGVTGKGYGEVDGESVDICVDGHWSR